MRLQEIIGIIQEYFSFALIAVLALGLIFSLLYFMGYKKRLKGRKNLSTTKILLVGLFMIYLIMVIGVTILNRGENSLNGAELSLFSSYREAWYIFDARHWQFVLLNIFMFVPFGFLLPLLHKRFHKAQWTIGLAALFTLSIESFQLVSGFGLFELDDLFNNLLGAIIGYGVIMGLLTLKKKKFKRSALYFSPLFLVLLLFGSMLLFYQLKPFGNLSITAVRAMNMDNVTPVLDIKLSDERVNVPLYQVPTFSKKDSDQFFQDFFQKIEIDTSNMEDISYPGLGMYRVYTEESYHFTFDFLGGYYTYRDFSSFNEEVKLKNSNEHQLEKALATFGITLPPNTTFSEIETGEYEWTAHQKVMDNQLIDGSLTVHYYSDHTIKSIDHQLVAYDLVEDVQLKSEQEVYEDILKGKFNYYLDNEQLNQLSIHKVEITYHLDSKGYYQPVYAFHSTINGNEFTILMPAI